MLGNVGRDIPKEEFDQVFDGLKKRRRVELDAELAADDLKNIIAEYKRLIQKTTGRAFPPDPRTQLALAIEAVFRSWNNTERSRIGGLTNYQTTLVLPQPFRQWSSGNMGETSGTGVGFRRSPVTGQKQFYGEFLMNAEGEDVVAGVRTPIPIKGIREGYAASVQAATRNHYEARASL
jgi:pyruvate,orthophosphate dikinase